MRIEVLRDYLFSCYFFGEKPAWCNLNKHNKFIQCYQHASMYKLDDEGYSNLKEKWGKC